MMGCLPHDPLQSRPAARASRIRFVAGLLCLCRITCTSAFEGLPDADCKPHFLGFGPPGAGHGAANALALCGVSLLRNVFPAEKLRQAFNSFISLPSDALDALRFGSVREERRQVHAPFSSPFDNLELLGDKGQLLAPLLKVLGDDFVLDIVTVVSVPPGAAAQEPHRDTPLEGSISVHVPLQALTYHSAPLGMCAGTCNTTSQYSQAVFREALLWRPKDESSQDAKRRLFCGGRQRTTVHDIELPADKVKELKLRSGRLGARVAEISRRHLHHIYGLRVNDEITHVRGIKTADEDEVIEHLGETIGVAGVPLVDLRLERPLEGPLPYPDRLTVGAPLEVGDALLYDSRTWHWGMANKADTTRYVLYVVFKKNESHAGIHPEAGATPEVSEARRAFREKFGQLREEAFAAAHLASTAEL